MAAVALDGSLEDPTTVTGQLFGTAPEPEDLEYSEKEGGMVATEPPPGPTKEAKKYGRNVLWTTRKVGEGVGAAGKNVISPAIKQLFSDPLILALALVIGGVAVVNLSEGDII